MADEAGEQGEPDPTGDCFSQAEQGIDLVDNSILTNPALFEPLGGAPGRICIAEGGPRVARQIGAWFKDVFNHAFGTEHRPADARDAASTWRVRLLIACPHRHVSVSPGQ